MVNARAPAAAALAMTALHLGNQKASRNIGIAFCLVHVLAALVNNTANVTCRRAPFDCRAAATGMHYIAPLHLDTAQQGQQSAGQQPPQVGLGQHFLESVQHRLLGPNKRWRP